MADDDKKKEPTVEEQLAELQARVSELTVANESQTAELERLRKDKDMLLKDLKKVKDEREVLKQAQMSEEERKASEAGKLAELEAQIERERGEAMRYKLLSTTDHGLDPAFAKLVEGNDETSILASIEVVKALQAEAIKRLAPAGSPGTAPPPPGPAGGQHPVITEKDITAMSPQEFADFDRKVRSGEYQLASE